MDRTDLDTRRIFALLALDGHIGKPFFRYQRWVVIVF
jgi:hypothetical protein